MNISDSEIAVLNAARSILKEKQGYTYDSSATDVHAAVIAEVAGTLLFDFLNTAHNMCDIPMTDGQLHNHQAVTA